MNTSSQGISPENNLSLSGGYNPDHFSPLFAVEDRHFWFRARNLMIAALVRQVVRTLPPGYRVLEVGCGTGNVLQMLERTCRNGSVVGMDLFGEGLHYARRRTRCPLVQGDMRRPPFRVPFDVIGCFDVLEHIPDDLSALECLHEMLSPGATLIASVPAHPTLWSYFDEASGHCRRYTSGELCDKLNQAGFRVEYVTQCMAALFPMMWAGRRAATIFNRIRGAGGVRASPDQMIQSELRLIPIVNELLMAVLRQETRLIARRRFLPIGTSLLVIARK